MKVKFTFAQQGEDRFAFMCSWLNLGVLDLCQQAAVCWLRDDRCQCVKRHAGLILPGPSAGRHQCTNSQIHVVLIQNRNCKQQLPSASPHDDFIDWHIQEHLHLPVIYGCYELNLKKKTSFISVKTTVVLFYVYLVGCLRDLLYSWQIFVHTYRCFQIQ